MHASGTGLWNDEDKFFYDVLNLPGGHEVPLRVRSIVGLIPLFAVHVLEPDLLRDLPEFAARLDWFLTRRPHLARLISRWDEPGAGRRQLLSLLRGHRMKCLLRRMLDEAEFLSSHGVRSMSRHYQAHPYIFEHEGQRFTVGYEPAESSTRMFGGNSNWRGPIWMPINALLVESLREFSSLLWRGFPGRVSDRLGMFHDPARSGRHAVAASGSPVAARERRSASCDGRLSRAGGRP